MTTELDNPLLHEKKLTNYSNGYQEAVVQTEPLMKMLRCGNFSCKQT